MKGGSVIHKARRMAGLTQSELAQRLGTSPSVLSRWENGQVEPGFATVVRAVEASKLKLADVLNEADADPHDLSQLPSTLALTVDERLRRLIDYVRFVEAGRKAMRGR